MSTLAPLLVALGLVATGWHVLRLSGRGAAPLAEDFALSTVAGLVVTLITLALPLALTGRVTLAPVLALHGLALVGTVPHLARALRRRAHLGPRWLLGLVLAVSVVHLDVVTRQPFNNYDAKAIYGLKAKALLHERDLDGPLFQDPDVVHYHGDYPLGLPLLMAYTGWLAEDAWSPGPAVPPRPGVQGWLGAHDAVEAYAPLSLLWVLAFVCLVASQVRRLSAHGRGWLPATLVALPAATVAPVDIGASWRSTPELPLTLCLGVAVVLASRAQLASGRPREQVPGEPSGAPWLPLVLAPAGALLLKNDALLGLGSLVTVVALAVGVGRSRWRTALVLVAGSAAGLALVAALRSRVVGAPYDEDYLGALMAADTAVWWGRLPLLPGAVVESLHSTLALPFWAFTLAVALPWSLSRGGPPRFLAAVTLMHLGVVLLVFLVSPDQLHWHVHHALPRVWSQLAVPACVVAACGLTATLGARGPRSAAPPELAPAGHG